jgi:CheY-like chemotaxis protein
MFAYKVVEKGLKFETNISNSVVDSLELDELRFRQIILNLLSNAVKFTESGFVRLDVDAKNTTREKIDLVVKISDSGIGISADRIDDIFGVFNQENTKISHQYGGTGLSLSISKRIVNLFKGNIIVESTLGKGSEFIIELPNIEIGKSHDEDDEMEINATEIKFNNACILVIDDVENNKQLLLNHLTSFGLTAYSANNGQQGVQLAKKLKPDLIFMDIRMPIMDGYEASEILKNHEDTASIPIICIFRTHLNTLSGALEHFDGNT